MIEKTGQTQIPQQQNQKVLRMVKNERMGGYVPKWESVKATEKNFTEMRLGLAQNGQPPAGGAQNLDAALAYQAEGAQTSAENPDKEDSFGFGDLIDMVNPLHHIPLVGYAYRSITGDQIKPIGQIIGGAVFGGAAGAAVGLVNTVIQEETGKDVAGNTYAMVVEGKKPQFKSHASNNPEKALSAAAKVAQDTGEGRPPEDLPAALLAFTPPAYDTGFKTEKVKAAQGRTAGYFSHSYKPQARSSEPDHIPAAIREPITQLQIKGLPDRNDLY
jgi:hypothetical protein